jgi:hypothetical protein
LHLKLDVVQLGRDNSQSDHTNVQPVQSSQ